MNALLILLGVAAVFWYTSQERGEPKLPEIALVERSPELHAEIVSWHKQQHDTFAQRHTVNWS